MSTVWLLPLRVFESASSPVFLPCILFSLDLRDCSFLFRLALSSAVHNLVFSAIIFVLRFPTSPQGSLLAAESEGPVHWTETNS